jgi:hypothetical protein
MSSKKLPAIDKTVFDNSSMDHKKVFLYILSQQNNKVSVSYLASYARKLRLDWEPLRRAMWQLQSENKVIIENNQVKLVYTLKGKHE